MLKILLIHELIFYKLKYLFVEKKCEIIIQNIIRSLVDLGNAWVWKLNLLC